MARGRETTQRVKELKENFMQYHREGLGIPEISKRCNVTTTTIYKVLQEIADANGVERKELLERVHPPHNITSKVNRRQSYSNFQEIKDFASSLDREVGELLVVIKQRKKK